ncbi:hypothetical protein TWF694_011226 [Orbilia ellipsospora]|uniref:Uncharacterized protein n=1 Tax=Orbilia ellipsospora TaxID=2528407 RepID=A0AAV9X9L4_9PEZI
MYNNLDKMVQETRRPTKKKARRPSFRNKQEEVEWMAHLVMEASAAEFDRLSDGFFGSGFQNHSTESQYTAFNKVVHPKHAKVDIQEWLFDTESPYTHSVASSSQQFQTNTLTPCGYNREQYLHSSRNIAYDFPMEVMMHGENPRSCSTRISRRKKDVGKDIEELAEEEEENVKLEREFRKLGISKQTSRRRRSAKVENNDASEYKAPRKGGKKSPID